VDAARSPPAPLEDAEGRIGWADFALIAFQLVLLLLVLRQYQIENAAFRWLAQLAFAGFVIHAFLPLRYRLPFFALLSLAGAVMVLGAVNFAWMFGIGLVLIGICHLPVSFGIRVALLVIVGGLLAAQRAGIVGSPWSEAIWPILGSMFMFRLILYFHDLRHSNAPVSLARTLSYFFMLPNASFPLFPVVDHEAFRRNYYDRDTRLIYQTGVDWMVRGVIHLLLYRIVYLHLTLTPAEVTSPALLMQYIVTSFALYLKVSGLFHLIVGMLYLFGFSLPETHNRYVLAAGITDFWRRINIYWKEFMQKVFYYPAVFKLKRFGTTTAILGATIWVFLLTWFLHAYQWFWIRGTAFLVLQDILFWLILGLLVAVNALYESKHGRTRTLGKPKFSWRAIWIRTLKAYATFWFICILWSFWTTESVDHWLSLWRVLDGNYTIGALLWPLLTFVVIFVGNIPMTRTAPEKGERLGVALMRDRAITVGAMAVLIAVSIEPVFSRFGTEASTIVHSLRSGALSRIDMANMERGYYESLTNVGGFNSQLWEVYAKKPRNWLEVENSGLKRFVGGFVQTELIPSFASSTKYGTITINRFGMRDRDYAEQPSPGTFRAVLLGASSVMGWGVPDDATFEALLEERLNRERAGAPFAKYELLNFGVPGYFPPQQLPNFERALRLHPNVVMYIATGREQSRSVNYLAEVMHKGIEIPYAPLREIVARAGVTKGMKEAEAQQRLAPFANDILKFVYADIGERAKQHGMRAVWIFLAPDTDGAWQEEGAGAVRIAEAAGFVVISLEDIFQGKDVSNYRLAEWDHHPNALGHRLIADQLFERFSRKADQIFMLPSPRAQTAVINQTSGTN
jgi:D-alanyl-lipoteichoic acid acyltransferase DltB (MBOAT superfamily)